MKRLAPFPLLLLLVGLTALAYGRVYSAGFVGFDDDIHVYENPLLNPPSLRSVAALWHEPYERLYVPLAYTLYAAIAATATTPAHFDEVLGKTITLDPMPFHVVGVIVHVANVLLGFLLLRRLLGRTLLALLGVLAFALHPLQLESVAWISEFRGLMAAFFSLLALHAFMVARRAGEAARLKSAACLGLSSVLVVFAMLCKPAAVVLPLVALAIDRTLLATRLRTSLLTAGIWALCATPFALVTQSLQPPSVQGWSTWWQRPFIAGDALAFYLAKAVLPVDLCVAYGRTPTVAMSNAWGYVAWAVPAAFFALCYRVRNSRPVTWLGALWFGGFLLPTLGLVPFTYQAYSTVADRYVYLALIGAGLVVADTVDRARLRGAAISVLCAAALVLAALTFHQSRHWSNSATLLQHTIDVNPRAAFAYHNLGDRALARGEYFTAMSYYEDCLRHDSTLMKTYVNLAEVYSLLGQAADVERTLSRAAREPGLRPDGMGAHDFSRLGHLLMKTNQQGKALRALSAAVELALTSPIHLYDLANALASMGRWKEAEAAFRNCIAVSPDFAGAHSGLGIVLAQTNRLPEAIREFREAVRLEPDNATAVDNLRRAESLMESQRH